MKPGTLVKCRESEDTNDREHYDGRFGVIIGRSVLLDNQLVQHYDDVLFDIMIDDKIFALFEQEFEVVE